MKRLMCIIIRKCSRTKFSMLEVDQKIVPQILYSKDLSFATKKCAGWLVYACRVTYIIYISRYYSLAYIMCTLPGAYELLEAVRSVQNPHNRAERRLHLQQHVVYTKKESQR